MFGGYASKALCFNVCNARFVGEMQTCLHAECRINSLIIRACGYADCVNGTKCVVGTNSKV